MQLPTPSPARAGARALGAAALVGLLPAALLCPLALAPEPSAVPLAAALVGEAVLGTALALLMAVHLGTTARVAGIGAVASAASLSAVVTALAARPLAAAGDLDLPTAHGLLVVAAGAACLVVMALVTASHARGGRDHRPRAAGVLAAVALLLPAAVLARQLVPGGAQQLLATALLVLVGGAGGWAVVQGVRSSPPRVRQVPWDGDLAVHALSCVMAVGVLAFVDVSDTPVPWLLGVVALGCVGAKVLLLQRELFVLRGVRRRAHTDTLTGLANRTALLAELDAAAAAGAPLAVLLLDLDGFRRVNDALGHRAGDEVLRSAAQRLVEAAGHGAVVARLGSDEFAVLLTGAGAASRPAALQTAAAVHEVLGETHEVEGFSVVAAAHTGVVVEPAPGGTAPLDLLRRADVAMHWARTLRSEPVEHHSGLDDAVRESVELVGELRRALDGDQVRLHFQPQVDVLTGRVRGTEALVRWAHPERGVLTPDVFLPVAAEAGLMGRLTSVVLEAAIGQAAAWDRAGTPVPVSVNLTATDVRPELVDEVAQLLVREQLPASLLVLEITETVLVVDPAGTAAVLADLVELGVEVSIDDFGTGYSSLEVLLSLPVTELKIDRTFVSRALSDLSRYTVVRSTIDLAHGLGLRVVAEGVEDDDVLRLLRELGCDVSQGYLHSRPLPAPEATAWLAAHADPAPTSPHEAVPG
ncbi:putative bifunctional diguanylate cyclase/phosphodiesterase [Quadrisphaera setariae]|uniref:Bifunctional diguanylate cyclase/phosphodiesterase n=1 Tax=Quadrisphaera setariae TaxID=2593304 RepID=A0A5C8Z758_9ACTN|nr:bifunctional diguanylate cyclase/phosphodiesterase [Quadrisphaera setariae]TXR52696.1 bifunctional diguanylate cyclase/phosphodiesterase [Quadrisphaera setariae]